MRTIVVANQKGGVGKSAIAAHVAFYAAEKKKRVLVLDLDAQATATNNLLSEVSADAMGASQFFLPGDLQGRLQQVDGKISVIAGDKALSLVDESPEADEYQPAVTLRALADAYDLCVIDPPPTLGKRLRAALIAADFVVMPFAPVRESTDGLGQLLETIDRIRDTANARLQYLGLLANKVNPRSVSQRRALAQVSAFAGEMLLSEVLYERAAVPDMLASNRPVWKGIAGESHRKAAAEMTGVCKTIIKRVFK